MTYYITSPCLDELDLSCIDVCPVDCIAGPETSHGWEEGVDKMLYIDPIECIDCGACVPACPVDAIFTEDTVPEDQAPFYDINVLWFQDPAAARAKVEEFLGGAPAAAPAAEATPASSWGAAPSRRAFRVSWTACTAAMNGWWPCRQTRTPRALR